MKSLIYAVLAGTVLATPVMSFAQPTVTRAQLQAELAELEQAGYNPSAGEATNYPNNLLEAKARVAARHAAAQAPAQP